MNNIVKKFINSNKNIMKRFKLYSILFVLSFFLFTCEDDGENVKEKDKFTSVHDKTFWMDTYSETYNNQTDIWHEGFYFTKDYLNYYDFEDKDNINPSYDYCDQIPIKDGNFTDQDGSTYLLNVLVNKEDTLTLQFAVVEEDVPGETYWEAGELDFVVKGNLLTVTMHYLEENGTFDSEVWGTYTKTDDSERPTGDCPYGGG